MVFSFFILYVNFMLRFLLFLSFAEVSNIKTNKQVSTLKCHKCRKIQYMLPGLTVIRVIHKLSMKMEYRAQSRAIRLRLTQIWNVNGNKLHLFGEKYNILNISKQLHGNSRIRQ